MARKLSAALGELSSPNYLVYSVRVSGRKSMTIHGKSSHLFPEKGSPELSTDALGPGRVHRDRGELLRAGASRGPEGPLAGRSAFAKSLNPPSNDLTSEGVDWLVGWKRFTTYGEVHSQRGTCNPGRSSHLRRRRRFGHTYPPWAR
jgi:hypothetical protein